jgi:hypothetical protein
LADRTSAALRCQHLVILIACYPVFAAQHAISVAVGVFNVPCSGALDLNIADAPVFIPVSGLRASLADAHESIRSTSIDVELFKRLGDFAAIAGFNDWVGHRYPLDR